MKKSHLISLFFVLIVFSCQEKAAESYAIEMADTTAAVSENYDKKEAVAAAASEAILPPAPKVGTNNAIAPKIIRNANLRFETQDLVKTYKTLAENCKKNKAIVQSDVENNNNYRLSRNITIRIPSQNFDVFLAELSHGVPYFELKEISSRDVTAEFIDNESRISSKKKLENRYLELLKKANKVQEMLEIEKQLSEIREEIEAKEGQQKYLQNQVSMSTIDIEFYKNSPTQDGARISFISKIWNAVVSGFNSLANFFVNLIALWPFLLILVAIIYLVRKKIIKKKQS